MSRPSIQHIMPSGHLPACLTAAGIAWVILMGPISSGSSIGGCFLSFGMFWFFGCQVPCSPNTQDLVARVRAMRTSISYQRIHKPYLGIFSEICLFSMLLSLFNFKMHYTHLILEIVFQSPLLFCGSFGWP